MAFERALALDPELFEAHEWYGEMCLRALPRFRDFLARLEADVGGEANRAAGRDQAGALIP